MQYVNNKEQINNEDDEKYKKLKNLYDEIKELGEISNSLSEIINSDQEKLENISNNLDKTENYIDKGNSFLEDALVYKISKKKITTITTFTLLGIAGGSVAAPILGVQGIGSILGITAGSGLLSGIIGKGITKLY